MKDGALRATPSMMWRSQSMASPASSNRTLLTESSAFLALPMRSLSTVFHSQDLQVSDRISLTQRTRKLTLIGTIDTMETLPQLNKTCRPRSRIIIIIILVHRHCHKDGSGHQPLVTTASTSLVITLANFSLTRQTSSTRTAQLSLRSSRSPSATPLLAGETTSWSLIPSLALSSAAIG